MSERHWIIAFNEKHDECRFMQLDEEWLPFKYASLEDCQPDWQSIGLYESRYQAYEAYIAIELIGDTDFNH